MSKTKLETGGSSGKTSEHKSLPATTMINAVDSGKAIKELVAKGGEQESLAQITEQLLA